MSGFMSSSTAMTICKADSAAGLTLDALRAHAFTPDIDADGRRLGWVALGDPLDTDGFELAAVDGRYSGFSFRLDTRKGFRGRYPASACRSRHRQTDRQGGICAVRH